METDDIDIHLVSQIRDKFIETLNDDETAAKYDERDINRVRNNDGFVWRFIEDRKVDTDLLVSTTVKNLSVCLAWRKERGINDLKVSVQHNVIYLCLQ